MTTVHTNSYSYQMKFALIAIFLPAAFLFSSQGVITLQLIKNYNVPISQVKYLDVFLGASTIMASFLLSSTFFTLNYKTTIVAGALIETAACLIFMIHPLFLTAGILFFSMGAGFAFIKIAAYSTIRSIINTPSKHASFLHLLGGSYMVGGLSGFWVFRYFINSGNWLSTFGAACTIFTASIIIILRTPFSNTQAAPSHPVKNMHRTHTAVGAFLKRPVILTTLAGVFLYMGIETGLSTWLPTLESELLHISPSNGVAAGGLLVAGIALGRLASAVAIRHVHWATILQVCVIAIFSLLAILSLSINFLPSSKHTLTHWSQLPWMFYLTPLIGFFLGPIHPTLYSVALTNQPIHSQKSVMALLLLFDVIGASLLPFTMGGIFQTSNGLQAMTVPLTLTLPLLALILVLNKITLQKPRNNLCQSVSL